MEAAGIGSANGGGWLVGVLAVGLALAQASPAVAGQWMRSSCINPNGASAASEGWSAFAGGGAGYGSYNSVVCSASAPMVALLSAAAPAPVGANETLVYTPPEGSRLSGGVVGVDLLADGGGMNASGVAAIYTPAYVYDGSNVVVQCASGLTPCANGTHHFIGPVTLPSNRGGSLYVSASCGGNAGWACNTGSSEGVWSRVLVSYANLLLVSSVAPTGSDFGGSLLSPEAHGTAGLSFTAAAGGPGVWKVKVAIDGKPVYDATPNTNARRCVSVGSDRSTGALVFGYQQPCLQSQRVDLTVRTTGLRDGEHELRVTVIDAAQNTQTVLRRTITTNNRTTTSSMLTSDPPGVGPSGGAARSEYAVDVDGPTRALMPRVRRAWKRSALTLSGTLRTDAGALAPGVPVTLFVRDAVQPIARVVAHASTDAAGRWTLRAPRGPSRTLTIVGGPEPDPSSRRAVEIRQAVRPGVSLRVRALGRGRLAFSGRVQIAPLGSPRPMVIVQTRNAHGGWKEVGSSLRVDRFGNYSVVLDGAPDTIGGSYAFRTLAYATSLFATGVSPIRRKVVR